MYQNTKQLAWQGGFAWPLWWMLIVAIKLLQLMLNIINIELNPRV
jgi:hypothetical protein